MMIYILICLMVYHVGKLRKSLSAKKENIKNENVVDTVFLYLKFVSFPYFCYSIALFELKGFNEIKS